MYIEELSKIATQLGGFILCFGLVSYFVKERLRVSEALISTLVGIILGPKVLRTLDPTLWGSTDELIHGFTRIVIAIQVMFSGVTLPKAYLVKEKKSLAILLIPVMSCMWLISGLAIHLLIPSITFTESLVLASCVTSTDPILANSVVKGKFAEKHVPPHIRNLLSAESGVTDGMAEQFLYLSIYLMDQSFGQAIGQWILIPILYKIGLSIVIGVFTGYVARKLLYLSEKNRLIDKESFLVFAIALALFLTGFVSIIGGSDLLACFIAGTSFTWDDWFRRETEEAHLQEVIDMLLNLAVFALIGSLIPWKSFVDAIVWWRLLLLSIIILVFRRMPAVFVLSKMNLIPAVKTYREVLFTGWFGPIGVGAIYCSTLAKLELDNDGSHKTLSNIVLPVVFFLVFISIMVHGITIPLVMISKRINTRTFTAGSVYNQVSRLPVIRIGQDVFFTTDDKGNILPSVFPQKHEDFVESNISESTTIEIVSPQEGIADEITLSEVHDMDSPSHRDMYDTQSSHDLNLEKIRAGISWNSREINMNIPHDITKTRKPKRRSTKGKGKEKPKHNEEIQDEERTGSLSSKYAIWDEGDNYIIENFEGEDIRVIPSSSVYHLDHGEGNNGGKRGSGGKINFFKKRLSKSESPTKDMVEDGKNKENEKSGDAKAKEEIKDEKTVTEIKDEKAMEESKEDKGKKKEDDETE